MMIPLARLAPADYARPISETAVESLMQSIERLGLLQPIIVVAAKINRGVLCDGWRIVAGHHRAHAAADPWNGRNNFFSPVNLSRSNSQWSLPDA